MLSLTDGEKICKLKNSKDKTKNSFIYFKDIHTGPSELQTSPKDLFKDKYSLDTVLDELGIEKHEFGIIINMISNNLDLPANVNMNLRRAHRRLQNIINRKLRKEIHLDLDSPLEICPIVLDDKKFSHHISVFGATSSGKSWWVCHTVCEQTKKSGRPVYLFSSVGKHDKSYKKIRDQDRCKVVCLDPTDDEFELIQDMKGVQPGSILIFDDVSSLRGTVRNVTIGLRDQCLEIARHHSDLDEGRHGTIVIQRVIY